MHLRARASSTHKKLRCENGFGRRDDLRRTLIAVRAMCTPLMPAWGAVMKRVGLVGGLGVGAAIYYYEKLAAAFVDRGVQPGLVISHADIGRAYTMVQQGQ